MEEEIYIKEILESISKKKKSLELYEKIIQKAKYFDDYSDELNSLEGHDFEIYSEVKKILLEIKDIRSKSLFSKLSEEEFVSDKNIRRIVDEHGYKFSRKIEQDGNSQFASIADLLPYRKYPILLKVKKIKPKHVYIREKCIAVIKSRREKYKKLIDKSIDNNIGDYMKRMSNDEETGDFLTLNAAAAYFKCKITLISDDGKNGTLNYFNPERGWKHEIVLCLYGGEYYQSLLPK